MKPSKLSLPAPVIYLAVLLFMGFPACDIGGPSEELKLPVENTEELIHAYNRDKLSSQKAYLFKGAVSIWKDDRENFLRVIVTPKEGSAQTFTLQLKAAKDATSIREGELPAAEILYFRTSLLLQSADGAFSMFLAIDPSFPAERLKVASFTHHIVGDWLSRNSGDLERTSTHCKCCVYSGSSIACAGGGPPDDECDSGGLGSTGCAIGNINDSCEVAGCEAPAFSCCWEV